MNRQESNRLEFKHELSESFEREVVAFLNYPGGGTILLGVDDDGLAVGLDRIDELQLKIADRIKVSDRTVRSELKQRKEMGILLRNGSDRYGHWEFHHPEKG